MALAADAVRLDLPAAVRNEINITRDLSPGWIPTAEQRQRALKTVQTFLDAVEGRRYVEAYGQQNELIKRSQTLAQFTQEVQKFSVLAGPVKLWTVLKVIGPRTLLRRRLRGIYAAIDLAGPVRQCGSRLRLHGAVSTIRGWRFHDYRARRGQQLTSNNATARDIEQKQSKRLEPKVWGNSSSLSQLCLFTECAIASTFGATKKIKPSGA